MTPDSGPRHPARGRRAFTLIEVLVVVAIIALLVAILIPSLSKARQQARRTMCGSNLHQIGAALLMYRETYKEYPHQAMIGIQDTNHNGQVDPGEPGEAFGLLTTDTHRILARFLKTGFSSRAGDVDATRAGELFYCPSVDEKDRGGDILGEDQLDTDAEPYLHITYAYFGRLDQALNDPAQCSNYYYDDPANCTSRQIPARRKLYVTKEPDARHVLMEDMVMFWGGGDRPNGRWRVNHGPWYQPYNPGQSPSFEGANVAYGDGHVEWKKAAQFPDNLRKGAAKDSYVATANLVRDKTLPDAWWW